MEKQKASIGRIVHYMRYGSPGGEHLPEPSPAVVVKVNDEATQQCQLFVMNPNGLYFNDTPFSDEPKPGHWSWMPFQKQKQHIEIKVETETEKL